MFCQWLIGYIKLILNAKTNRKTDIFLDEIEFGKKWTTHLYSLGCTFVLNSLTEWNNKYSWIVIILTIILPLTVS